MDIEDLHITSNMTHNNSAHLSIAERLIDLTLKYEHNPLLYSFVANLNRHVISSMEESSVQYLGEASRHVEGLKTSKHSIPQILLVKGLVSALKNAPSSKSLNGAIDQVKITRKLRKMVEHRLSKFAQKAGKGDETMLSLRVALAAVDSLADTLSDKEIVLDSEAVAQLEALAKSYVAQENEMGWKLRKFLVANYPARYKEGPVISWLNEPVDGGAEDAISDLIEAYIKGHDRAARAQMLDDLIQGGKLTSGSTGSLLAVKKIIEQQAAEPSTAPANGEEGSIDIAAVHGQLAPLLTQTETILHFNHLSDALLLLVDKHASGMTQFSIELTLGSVIDVCSPAGPELRESKAAGQVYDRAYKLVAAVIKRHRLRLEGRLPLLITTLQAMLRVVLTDPGSPQTQAQQHPDGAQSAHRHPPWLTTRLQARHAARFSRLLTLVCEPSVASVARHSSSTMQQLDSATDAAKRAAGLDMYAVLEAYIKLQLDSPGAGGVGAVPRDVRAALEPGIYSVLSITPHGCRRVMNESLDSNGRALFRSIFADYKKFGRWSGI